MFNKYQDITVRSAGINEYAPLKLAYAFLRWADLIFVMEQRHYGYLIKKHLGAIYDKNMIILGICDQYQFMDAELIKILEERVTPYLKE